MKIEKLHEIAENRGYRFKEMSRYGNPMYIKEGGAHMVVTIDMNELYHVEKRDDAPAAVRRWLDWKFA